MMNTNLNLAEIELPNIGGNVVFLKSGSMLDLGFPIFPCVPSTKKPYKDSNGFKDATTDLKQISSWWIKHADALVAMPTGKVSGYVVLDVDDRDGSDGKQPRDGSGNLDSLEQQYGKLPDTWEVLTPSGGRHFWFKYPDTEVRNTQSRIGEGLDIRGEGGYVIIPPSKKYHWEASNTKEPAEMPEWLIKLATEKKKKHGKEKNSQQKV